MANVIKHKRGSGSDPVASDLVVGEVAIRTDVGKLFTKMDNGSVAEIAGGGSDIAINTLSSSSATGGGSATFNGSAYRFTLSSPPSVSAQQLLVSINGVIQKPVAGTGQPSEGFSVDGNDIILGDAPAAGSDFFILTFKSLGVSEPADNSVTSAKIATNAISGTKIADGGVGFQQLGDDAVTTAKLADGAVNNARIADDTITNAKINSSAAIAGSKLNPVGLANVGIGTSSPNSRLNLKLSSRGTSDFRITDSDTTSDVLRAGSQADGDGFLQLRTIAGAGNVLFDASGVSYLNGGNVGIGTTSPDTKLHLEASNNGVTAMTSANNRLRFTDTDTTVTSNQPTGVIEFESRDSGNEGIQAYIACKGSNTGQGSLHFATGKEASSTLEERMTIDQSGRLLIGTTALGTGSADNLVIADSADCGITIRSGSSSGGNLFFTDLSSGDQFQGYVQYDHGNDSLAFGTQKIKRMSIDSSGNVHIGKTASDFAIEGFSFRNLGSGAFAFQAVRDGSGGAVIECNRQTNVGRQIEFYRGSSNLVGHIECNNTSTAYNTSGSDRTLKKNFESWNENVLDLFKSINPQKFNFIQEDDEAEKSKGFVAQDMVSSFPEAYTKGEEEDSKYFFNPSGMVVYLMKALQEAVARIEALEAK